MEQQQQQQPQPLPQEQHPRQPSLSRPSQPHHPQLHNILPPHTSQIPPRSANSTPISSPGLFSPTHQRTNMSLPQQVVSEGTTPVGASNSPFLHPLQSHKVRETHKALVDTDFLTGRKMINQYEIIDELGRGVHGKVKLARNLETGENVAIKIIPRFSKKRRLGKITTRGGEDKVKKEIAILKKIRHANVVALLEVIDDPELKKIYMVLEHVELGEIVWRKKGLPHICAYERRRVEREMRGEQPTAEEERYDRILERRQALKDVKRAKLTQSHAVHADYWSLEYGAADDDEAESQSRLSGKEDVESESASRSVPSNTDSAFASKATSRVPSRTQSVRSITRTGTPQPSESDLPPLSAGEDMETPVPLRSNPVSSSALDGTMYGAYVDDSALRGRSPSMADSIISHMSSVDYNRVLDPNADDFSYVPCFTIDQARNTFRGTVLGLEYLHYEGIIHRDIKPANLLWTRDHRVKISDFGVSYFGRPTRAGEPDETVSESEAHDFDNDLELAKTVGTPAFFAPELCYTDIEGSDPPRVNEQIDVWSLGVTLYCLIFARIPFLADDEWQMFRKIATEDVYIPRRRLRPVDPSTKPDEKSLYTRVNSAPYRDDDELVFEEIPDDLHSLLERMLTKSPEKRIKLRDVKRHPWVTKGIPNVIAWLDDTDPSRRRSGKIQVDEREMAHAVIPLTFLERARSAVKRAVGKVMHSRSDRAESSSRRRAESSTASSGGEGSSNIPSTPHNPRDSRRRSLRGDDYFANAKDYPQWSNEHPLSQSVTASPHESPLDDGTGSNPSHVTSLVGGPQTEASSYSSYFNAREDATGRQTPTTSPRIYPRHSHARSMNNAFLSLIPAPQESRTVPPTPLFDSPTDDPSRGLRNARETPPPAKDSTRARSVDRGFFGSNASDKRAEPTVALSTAVAPGTVQSPVAAHSARSIDLGKSVDGPAPQSPKIVAPRALTAYQHNQPKSDPNMHDRQRIVVDLEERPMTAHRVQHVPEGIPEGKKTPPPRVYQSSTPESFARSQEQALRRQRLDFDDQVRRERLMHALQTADPTVVPRPVSAGNDAAIPQQRPEPPSREDTIATLASSNNTSMGALPTTPLTSPSETTSPVCLANPGPTPKENMDQMLTFQSDPSLPALLSGASSVSADPEGDFLGGPGVVNRSPLLDTTDSLTPPAMNKEPGLPLEQQELVQDGAIPVEIDDGMAQPPVPMSPSSRASCTADEDDDDDSDSDEGLTMAKSRKRSPARDSLQPGGPGRTVFAARRRDTNASVGSTETAKKVVVDGD